MNRLPHPSLLPALPTPTNKASARRPLDLRVHAQRIQIQLIVTDPRPLLAHARTAAHDDPDTAALVGYSTTTPLSLYAATLLQRSVVRQWDRAGGEEREAYERLTAV
ncbi:hypothetical protein ACFWNZ_33485, partial [Streptomyces rubiginosohelvolus]